MLSLFVYKPFIKVYKGYLNSPYRAIHEARAVGEGGPEQLEVVGEIAAAKLLHRRFCGLAAEAPLFCELDGFPALFNGFVPQLLPPTALGQQMAFWAGCSLYKIWAELAEGAV
jgi:hypothetical protein